MLRKIFRPIGLVLLMAFTGLNIYILVSGKTFFYKTLAYNFADVDDYKIFDNRTIHKSKSPQAWPLSTRYNQAKLSNSLQQTLDTLQSFAFLIIKNDSLVYETYSEGYGTSSYSNSFSIAKTVVSILTGIALKEGKIKSLDQPIGDFLEDFKNEGKEKITIRHLLTMSSGLNWDESYSNPFSMTSEAYYGKDLPKLVSHLRAIESPGQYFKYLSGNTEVLGMVLEKAVGQRIGEYAEEKLWQPLGMENDALWSTDKENGTEKAYCCINSNARDFAKIGKLYLHQGNWNGRQLIDSGYVKASTHPAPLLDPVDNKRIDYYGYQWWLIPNYKGLEIFYARGILGQYIIVIPEKNLLVVRLGKKRGEKVGEHLKEVYAFIDEAVRLYP